MSAFVVQKETIDRALTLWDSNYDCHIHRLSCEQLDSLGLRIWQLNCEAVNQRYPHTPGESVAENYRYRWGDVSTVVALKALQCIIYQCSEGNVPETALYKEMRDVERRAMHKIIDELPEYQAAPWDYAPAMT